MTESLPFTIENFFKFVGEKRLMAAKCNECNTLLLPPRPMCPKCLSTDLKWVELGKKGKLLTYTVIHVPPPSFQTMAPYAVGIIGLEEGPRLPGMIRGIKHEKIMIGMELIVDFETTLPREWPMWPHYYFKPTSLMEVNK